ncbi:MAG: EAL domain-containing protein [Pseudomonadota bacterium]
MKKLNNKCIKKANQDLAKYSINGVFVYLMSWLLISNFSSISSYNFQLVYAVGFSLLIIGVLRLLLVHYFEPLYNHNPKQWQWFFSLGMIASAALWSLFTTWAFSQVGLTIEGIIILLPLIMFSSGGIISLSPNKKLLIAYLGILTIPQVVFFISIATTHSYVISFMFTVFEIFLLKMGIQIHENYWELLKSSEDNVRLYAKVFENSGEAILITDSDNKIISINQALNNDMGYSLEELLGKTPSILKSEFTPQQTHQEMWDSLKKTGFWQGDLWDKSKDGKSLPKWAVISAIHNEKGELTNYIASYTDLSKRKDADDQIHQLAHHDALTGLLNRRSLENRAKQALLTAKRDKNHLAIIFIDMDRFKIINDTKGHDVGDGLLIEVAKRLTSCVRECDVVARQGGDEFVVVLTALDDALISSAIAAFIVHSLGQPYQIKGHTLHSTPSLGISIYPNDGEEINLLLKHADTAMYHAKESGRNNYKFFTQKMNTIVAERAILENELRLALQEKQFVLFYQPKISGGTGLVCGFEALVRWLHPERGLVSPDIFISICEETRLINPLGDWVIEEACQQLEKWHKQGYTTLTMAINLSLQQFQTQGFILGIKEKLQNRSFASEQIEFEITESTAMFNPKMIIEKLKALRELNVQLAIDDFGTGYSSLAFLKRLPIQILKIDRTFVSNLENDESDAKISAATISLAHSLGLEVVAEGVENVTQENFLVEHHCEYLQGYLFSKPLPVHEATIFIQQSLNICTSTKT